MIKVDGREGRVELKGKADDLLAELGLITSNLVEAIMQNGLPEEEAKLIVYKAATEGYDFFKDKKRKGICLSGKDEKEVMWKIMEALYKK